MCEVEREPVGRRVLRPSGRLRHIRRSGNARGALAGRQLSIGLAASGDQVAFAIEHESAARELHTDGHRAVLEPPGAIGHLVAFEVPPRQRGDRGLLVRRQRSDLGLRQRPRVDACVLDGAGERRAAARPDVPQTEYRDVVVDAQQVDILRRVRSVRLAITVDPDVFAVVDDRHLYHRPGVGRLGGVAGLVGLRAAEEIAAGHPPAARPLAEYDRVESVAALNRQHAAALLAEVGGDNPRDKRLARARIIRGEKGCGAKQ